MALYTISDLHLSFSTDKPMDIFYGWDNHIDRLTANWQRLVKPEDTVVLPGDLSWALKLEQAHADFDFLNRLPGRKIILKGNHDLWWSTVKKMTEFFDKNKFDSIDIVFNNCVIAEDRCICGTRGWFFDDRKNMKILNREAARLEASIKAGLETKREIALFLHYPPVYDNRVCEPIFDVIKRYGIKQIYYGHIHGNGRNFAVNEYDGVKLKLVSCDCIDFVPYRIL